jgi:hypothetical protein
LDVGDDAIKALISPTVVSYLKSKHRNLSNSGREIGHLAGILALFLKEAAVKFSKITVVEAPGGLLLIALTIACRS